VFVAVFCTGAHHNGHMDSHSNSLTPPPSDSVAFFVKMQRWHWRWKQPTLASVAGVSLSTVERVERGEPVSPDSLSKIAVALGFSADYLTAPRLKLSEEEALRRLVDSVSWMEGLVEVPVAQLTTEKQLRKIASTDMMVVGSDLDEAAADDLAELREWIDLIGFMRCRHTGLIGPMPERSFRMRDLYGDLFQHLEHMQARHKAVCLVGTYTAETDSPTLPTATVAVVSLRSKTRNPAAARLTTAWCEQKVSWKAAMEHTP
jgi:transcriptional regulator with XRE-family HTH domain